MLTKINKSNALSRGIFPYNSRIATTKKFRVSSISSMLPHLDELKAFSASTVLEIHILIK